MLTVVFVRSADCSRSNIHPFLHLIPLLFTRSILEKQSHPDLYHSTHPWPPIGRNNGYCHRSCSSLGQSTHVHRYRKEAWKSDSHQNRSDSHSSLWSIQLDSRSIRHREWNALQSTGVSRCHKLAVSESRSPNGLLAYSSTTRVWSWSSVSSPDTLVFGNGSRQLIDVFVFCLR